MERHCFLANSLNCLKENQLFQFPFNDIDLMSSWLQKIPKHLYEKIKNPSHICEAHFENKFLQLSNGTINLHPRAMPSVFISNSSSSYDHPASSCRFCLKKFLEDDTKVEINNYIKMQFFMITDTELNNSGELSQSICDCCFNSSCNLATFRTKLLKNQKKLEDVLMNQETRHCSFTKPEIDIKEEEKDDIVTQSDEHINDGDDIEALYEEHLDIEDQQELLCIEEICQDSRTNESRKSRKNLCPDCGKSFSVGAFKRHYERVHLRVKKFHCDYCDYKSYSRSHIEIHVRSHLKIKTHCCDLCGSSYGNGNILRQHFLIHQKDRPFKCDQCLVSFKSIYALRRHQKTHSENKLKLICNICGGKFSDKWHLKRHQAQHEVSQSHICETCEKIYRLAEGLKAHQIYHRPPQFRCKSCKKEFYKRADLLSHLKTLSGHKDFHCKFCSNSYFKKAYLSRHMKILAVNIIKITMGSRKCIVEGCTSLEGQEKDAGVTFHRFPHNPIQVDKWLKACKMETNFKPTKNIFVCSRHFKRENFTTQTMGKIVLKSMTVPSMNLPGSKSAATTPKNITPVSSKPSTPPPVELSNIKIENEQAPCEPEAKIVEDISPRKSVASKKKTPVTRTIIKLPVSSKKSSKRLSAKIEKTFKKSEIPPATPEKVKISPSCLTPKKKNQVLSFVPGSSIEAQNFDSKWMPVKVIEVDMEEREVLVRSSDKSNKSKTGINDEWISMDSPRLRPAQPVIAFEVGEQVLARWNDCRKFPATIKRVLDNDSYDVLFDDGYPKIVRGIHINKMNSKNMPKTSLTEPTTPTVINPLLLNPPSLVPDYIKEGEWPIPPTEGEWCCTWVDEVPVGEESSFDGPHGKLPSIVVKDWRVKEGWQKHIYLRQNGKWDVLFISPTNRKLRFKNELKAYLIEIGETYDPEVWDFSMHKKRSKLLGLCITSDRFKNQSLSQSFGQDSSFGLHSTNNPFAALGALPYVQPNLVLPPPQQSEIRVGSLKVQVINNMYQCPAQTCDKTFRKENHLQLHIKHYHDDLAKLMGECLNMEDLAYLRTTVDEPEVSPTKAPRKYNVSKARQRVELNDSFREVHIKTETPFEAKFQAQRSPILEEALKSPIITSLLVTPKTERDVDIKNEFSASSNYSTMQPFDPESLIPPHAVSKPGLVRFGPGKKRLRTRFNPKPKRIGLKKRRFDSYRSDFDEVGSSSIQGIIPYHEGPYFKNQATSYVDDNGEVIKIVRMKKEEIINCICGYGEEDGLMIQCELCLCWQHGVCHNIISLNQVPEKYVCTICKNPYRQRSSQKYIHDQDWLFDGKLPVAGYHMPNANQPARYETLKQCHTLIGNLKEMKRFMNSLDVKINIAEKSGHPKLYLWAKKWEQSPPRVCHSEDSKEDTKRQINMQEDDGDIRMLPIVPEPELAIEPAKCQQTLLDHIENQQKSVKSRLDVIDAEISALEESSAVQSNGKKLVDDSKMKQTVFMLINDLMKMNEISSIHRSY